MEPNERSPRQIPTPFGASVSRRGVLRGAAALGCGAVFIPRARLAAAQAAGYGDTPKGPKVDKLVLWTRSSPNTSPNEYNTIKTVCDNYTKAVGTPIQIVTVADADFRNKMRLSAPNGVGPDVYGPLAHDWFGELAIEGIALEIPDSAFDHKDDFLPVSLQAVSLENKVYALPLLIETIALIYNKAMVQTPPETWADLVTLATKLTQGDKYGFGMPLVEPYHEGAFFHAFGSYIFKYTNGTFDTNDIGLNNAGGIEATKFLRDMYWKKQPPMPAAAIDKNNQHSKQEGMQEAGQLAMYIDGPWREGPLQKAKIDYGVAKIPSLPGGQVPKPFLGVQAWGASAYSKHKDAALDFVVYATGTSNAVAASAGFTRPPVRQSALNSAQVKASPTMAFWYAQAQDGIPMPNIPAMGQVWTPWGDAMQSIVPKNLPDDQVKSLLDNAVKQIKQKIKESES